ncbi:hypothetical protein P7K49_023501 [Saguinus oedipus]|uniref:Uncharacterized protein n=1 Tax=Saguinus oedipus TaxID=9490 RepID=A0ABQ9UMM6_SAGOE|nr:hypothetical protein P7K49_023501 [Saguinus oedipus]
MLANVPQLPELTATPSTWATHQRAQRCPASPGTPASHHCCPEKAARKEKPRQVQRAVQETTTASGLPWGQIGCRQLLRSFLGRSQIPRRISRHAAEDSHERQAQHAKGFSRFTVLTENFIIFLPSVLMKIALMASTRRPLVNLTFERKIIPGVKNADSHASGHLSPDGNRLWEVNRWMKSVSERLFSLNPTLRKIPPCRLVLHVCCVEQIMNLHPLHTSFENPTYLTVLSLSPVPLQVAHSDL